jgi:4,5-dihydroxyphthalate decarboxylase
VSRLQLSVCLSRNILTAPILSGQVVPEGIDWTVSALHPSEMFWRQLKFGDFDVSEMSLASLCIAADHGVRDWVALPLFTTRRFFHTGIVVRGGAAVGGPQDLAGKRVGVPEYQQTAAVWARGALRHEWGVAPESIQWFMERPPERSHGGATGFVPPPGVDLRYIPADSSIADMLRAGELDASLVYLSDRNLVDRSRGSAGSITGVRDLFDDPAAEGRRYFAETGLLPVNHTVVVRADLLRQHPWAALNIVAAFLAAKRAAFAPLAQQEAEIGSAGGLLEPWLRIGALPPDVLERIERTDPLPYGLRGQQHTLTTLARYLREQGLTASEVEIGSLFAESTRDL